MSQEHEALKRKSGRFAVLVFDAGEEHMAELQQQNAFQVVVVGDQGVIAGNEYSVAGSSVMRSGIKPGMRGEI